MNRTYMTMTQMQSDTYFTGKLYPKLNAYIRNKDGNEFYLFSSCQYRTQKRFKQSILERHSIAEGSKLIIEKE